MGALTVPDDQLVPVGPVQVVLHALADPVRLEMVRRLAASADGTRPCAALYDEISRSTASHHFSVLVDAGITRRVLLDGSRGHLLRRVDVDAALPGLLGAVVGATAAGLPAGG